MWIRCQKNARRRGSLLLLAIFFVIVASLLSVAFGILLPVESRAAYQSKLRAQGSLVAEAGIIEAILWLEHDPSNQPSDGYTLPSLSGTEQLPEGWTYATTFFDTDAAGNDLPSGTWRVVSEADLMGNTSMRATAYLETQSTPFFDDMMRAGDLMELVAGPNVIYYDHIHTNDKAMISFKWGWGSPASFNTPTVGSPISLTWATDGPFAGKPELLDAPKETPEMNDGDWSKVFQGGTAGYLGPIPDREIPSMSGSDSNNILNGGSNPDSFMNVALAGGSLSSLNSGVNLVPGGGLVVKSSTVQRLKLDLVSDPDDPGSVVPWTHDNDAGTPQFPPSSIPDNNGDGNNDFLDLHQKMVFETSSGNYTVIYEEYVDGSGNLKTRGRMWMPGDSLSGDPSVDDIDIDNGVIYVDKNINKLTGPSKNEKLYVSGQTLTFKFEDNTIASLFRADTEPTFDTSGSAIVPVDPTRERSEIGFSGFTIAGQDGIKLVVDGGVQPPKYGSKRAFIIQANMLSASKIDYKSDSPSLFYVIQQGCLMTEDQIYFARDDPNDGFVFKMDRTNRYLFNQTGDPAYELIHYEEDFLRGGD